MDFIMKELKSFCKDDDTCLFVILILVGFLICMFFGRNEGYLDYGDFDGSKPEADYTKDLVGVGIGKEPESIGIKTKEQAPVNGYGPEIGKKYELAKRGKQYKPYHFNQSGGLHRQESTLPTAWDNMHHDYYFIDGKANQFGPDRPLNKVPQPPVAPVAARGPVDVPGGVTQSSDSKLSLVLFYAPWCGHSKRMIGDYDSVITNHHGTTMNGAKLEVLKVDMESNPEGAKEYGVEVKGFPTLYTFTEVGGKKMAKLFNARTEDEIITELKNRTSQM
jgi:thiol-disulfide isomerase/thioredoxin